jgi:hypothetical protein
MAGLCRKKRASVRLQLRLVRAFDSPNPVEWSHRGSERQDRSAQTRTLEERKTWEQSYRYRMLREGRAGLPP